MPTDVLSPFSDEDNNLVRLSMLFHNANNDEPLICLVVGVVNRQKTPMNAANARELAGLDKRHVN